MKRILERQSHDIPEKTRRNILDELRIANVDWSGRLSEPDFLSRIYDLESLSSTDHRFPNAYSDIWQHRVNNPYDWDDDWIYGDPRFGLLYGSNEVFLTFLTEIVHPVVRDPEESVPLVDMFNEYLVHDGYQIVGVTKYGQRVVYAAERTVSKEMPASEAERYFASVLEEDYISKQITRMNSAINEDPELAIGTAKEFLETVCKTILTDMGKPFSPQIDLPQLVKLVREELQLLPEDVPEQARGAKAVKRILGSLGAVVQSVAELRGLYGSGHGKPAKASGLSPRQAKLVVNSASTLGIFFYETYIEKRG